MGSSPIQFFLFFVCAKNTDTTMIKDLHRKEKKTMIIWFTSAVVSSVICSYIFK